MCLASSCKHSKHTDLSSFHTVVTVKSRATYASHLSFLCFFPPFISSLFNFFPWLLRVCSLHFQLQLCAVCTQKTIEWINPVRTLTVWAPLPPTVLYVQLHFVLVREKKPVPRVRHAPRHRTAPLHPNSNLLHSPKVLQRLPHYKRATKNSFYIYIKILSWQTTGQPNKLSWIVTNIKCSQNLLGTKGF